MLAGQKWSSSMVLPHRLRLIRATALLVSYRRFKWWFASVLPRVCRVKSPVHRLRFANQIGIRDRRSGCLALRGRLVSSPWTEDDEASSH